LFVKTSIGSKIPEGWELFAYDSKDQQDLFCFAGAQNSEVMDSEF
tara:strand:+ start:146 stop:280 length:135 start_codon:yes stop_codon:yes gene_type:complete